MLLSGGVDSSVALALLKENPNYKIEAYYLKIWLEDELSYLGECPWEEDLNYAQAVCEQLNIPLKVISLQQEYHSEIVSYTIDAIRNGYTPNPDILCNTKVKFGAFLNKVGDKYDKVASGHYAKVVEEDKNYYLMKNPDPIKDQTYFLGYLEKDQLSKVLFPLGEYTKEEVRRFAEDYNLPTKSRKDSQGLCFLGKIKFEDFVKHHLGVKKGDLRCYETDEKLGDHDGFWLYTIGQRKGIKLAGGPWFVVKKDVEKNIVYISNGKDSPNRYSKEFLITGCKWFNDSPISDDTLRVKIRHGVKHLACEIKPLSNNQYQVFLNEEIDGIASGQFAVFYQNNYCLGAGIIK